MSCLNLLVSLTISCGILLHIFRATKTIYESCVGEQGLDLVGDVQSKPEIEKWVNDKGAR